MSKFLTIAMLAGRHGLGWKEALALLQTLVHLRNILHEGEVILIEGSRASVSYTAVFPMTQKGFMQLEIYAGNKQPTFVCTAIPASIRKLQFASDTQLLLVGESFSCFERISPDASRQIRTALTQSDAADAFSYLREAFGEWQVNREAPFKVSPPGVFRTIRSGPTGIALWVDGELRGSSIAERGHFDETLEVALRGALNDRRFLPLSDDDVERVEIEITRISPIGLRVWGTSAPRSDIAYRFSSLNDKNFGWYLPEVFLARQFRSPEEFFESLATEKAQSRIRGGILETRVVEDWLCAPNEEPKRLSGGSVAPTAEWLDSLEAMETIIGTGIAWLESVQSRDGALPRSVHPQTGRSQGFDMDRMAHMLLVLKEASETFSSLQNNIVEARLRKFIDAAWVNKRLGPTALMYYARVLLSEKDSKAERITRDALVMRYRFAKDDMILNSHLLWLVEAFPTTLTLAYDLAAQVVAFLSSPRLHSENPAAYAEAALSLQHTNPAIARRALQMLCDQQRADGSFPGDGLHRMPYVRGTAKIFEVLATDPSLWANHARPALAWILSFQIGADSAHWVLPQLRHRLVGGIRHDIFDQSLWIDAVGHTMLGCVRRARQLMAKV